MSAFRFIGAPPESNDDESEASSDPRRTLFATVDHNNSQRVHPVCNYLLNVGWTRKPLESKLPRERVYVGWATVCVHSVPLGAMGCSITCMIVKRNMLCLCVFGIGYLLIIAKTS